VLGAAVVLCEIGGKARAQAPGVDAKEQICRCLMRAAGLVVKNGFGRVTGC
jgi:hypothetical protein